MTILEKIKEKFSKFIGANHLSDNPKSQKYTYINDNKAILLSNVRANKIWYLGNGDELLNWYTNQETYGFAANPIYNRNKRQYFWSLSVDECAIKRVHSGIPSAIITTLTNVVGMPQTHIEDKEQDDKLNSILDFNDMKSILMQQARPLTMAEGWGCYKPTFNKELSNIVMIQYYEAEDVDFAYDGNILVGVVFKDYYKQDDKDYVLMETRYIKGGDSYIEYDLYVLLSENQIQKVDLSIIPTLANLKPIIIRGLNKVLAVPNKYLFDVNNKEYGKSYYDGKLDLFDDLDQILSQDSQTVRVSTPVEYYNPDILERSSDGTPLLPKVYNRQFIAKNGIPNGDGITPSKDIETTQPILNFEQYSANAKSKLDMILTGVLSPSTIGIDVKRLDNADAQREKEKITVLTRRNIIDKESRILKQLYSICLMLQEYLETGTITLKQYEISIKYDDFANPSFENELASLGPAWNAGQISTEKYVDLLWGDRISKEDKAREIAELNSNKQADNAFIGDIDENTIGTNNSEERAVEEIVEKVKQ